MNEFADTHIKFAARTIIFVGCHSREAAIIVSELSG